MTPSLSSSIPLSVLLHPPMCPCFFHPSIRPCPPSFYLSFSLSILLSVFLFLHPSICPCFFSSLYFCLSNPNIYSHFPSNQPHINIHLCINPVSVLLHQATTTTSHITSIPSFHPSLSSSYHHHHHLHHHRHHHHHHLFHHSRRSR